MPGRPEAQTPLDADVLVIGAGPTGLMLANQLMRQGCRPIIIEKNAGPARETRALGVHARTLEIYSQMGLADRALGLGRKMTGVHLWTNGEDAARLPLGNIGQGMSPFPFVLVLGQDDNERILGDDLRALGVEVQWRHELVGYTEGADGIVAEVRGPDGATSSVRTRWIAGCDGSRSTVRQVAGIEFVGAPYEEVFFVADTEASGSMSVDELNVYLWPEGFHIFFPMRGTNRWRVVGILPEALRGKEGVTFDDVIPSIRKEAGSRLEFSQCNWFSTYRIAHRRAAHFQQGRAFLVGDAAHVHSPVGAQGMNTGLQDAYNLAWKLALVAQGKARDELLRTYAMEREPFADWLLRFTDRAFEMVVSESPVVSRIRTSIAPRMLEAALHSGWVRHFVFRTVSQIGIHYRKSPLSVQDRDAKDGGVQAGDRFPWLHLVLAEGSPPADIFKACEAGRFNLIVMGQDAGDLSPLRHGGVHVIAVPDTTENRTVLDASGVPLPSFYLIRPDGYVGLAGRQFQSHLVHDWFREKLDTQ